MRAIVAFFMMLCSVWGWGQGTLTIARSNFPSGTNYTTSTWTATASTGETITGTSRLFLTTTSSIQIGGAETPHPYNSTAIPGAITKIEIKMPGTGSLRAWTPRVSSNAVITSATSGTALSSQTFTSNTGTLIWNLNASDNYKYFYLQAGGNTNIASITITYETPSTGPAINAAPNTLSGFTYVENSGPSPEKSFELSGSNLTGDITAAAPTGFEISKTAGSGFADNLSFTQTGGSVALTTVYARMKAGLSPTTYSGNITLSSTDATTVNVALNGTVTSIPVKPVITTPAAQTGTVGVAYTYQIVASQNPASYAVASGTLPLGLNLNLTTGLISGTPTAAGTSSVTVTASNAAGASNPATVDFSIAKGTQTAVLPDVNTNVGAANITLPLNTSAGLPITYVSDTSSVANVTGSTLSIGSAGTATITASHPGNADYTAFSKAFTVTVTVAPILIAGWDFENTTITGTNSSAPTVTPAAANLGTNPLGSVFTGYHSNTASDWSAGTGNGSTKAATVQTWTVGDYWQIKLSTAGYKDIKLALSQRGSGTGPKDFKLQYSTDGTTYSDISGATYAIANDTWSTLQTVSIRTFNLSALTAINDRSEVYFRIVNPSTASIGGGTVAAGGTSQVDDILVEGLPIPTTTWTGTVWSNNNAGPDATMPVIIDGDYVGQAFESKSLTVNSGKTLNVNTSVKTGNVTNNGHIIVADNASFVQTAGASYGGSGTFAVNRTSVSPVNKYAFWSSPIIGQNMYNIFGTPKPTYVMTYNTATNFYDVVADPAAAVAGKGYSIKTPTSASALSFVGAPHNGPQTIAMSTATDKYNLVGNPYPSNLDLTAFLSVNSANIGSTLWFWDNTGGTVTTQTGNTASNFGYATFNAAGDGTWVKAPNGTGTKPTEKFVKIGQAFIVEAVGTELTFNNSMRVANAGVNFNKRTARNAGEGKYWLTLSTSYNANVSQAITYQTGADNNLDAYDSRAIGLGTDAFYSFVGTEKLIIQGKAAFQTDDKVILGNRHFESGTFTIALTQKEGLFAEGQAVYLKDKLTGTLTNLQNESYTFTSVAGDFGDRFEIVYAETVLSAGNSAKSTLQVSRKGEVFEISSPSKINTVDVYDVSGKLIKSLKPNINKASVSDLARGVYILHIATATENVSKKVIK